MVLLLCRIFFFVFGVGGGRGGSASALCCVTAEQVEDVMNANTHTKAERRLRIVRATEKEDSWDNASDEENPTGKEGGADDTEVSVLCGIRLVEPQGSVYLCPTPQGDVAAGIGKVHQILQCGVHAVS